MVNQHVAAHPAFGVADERRAEREGFPNCGASESLTPEKAGLVPT